MATLGHVKLERASLAPLMFIIHARDQFTRRVGKGRRRVQTCSRGLRGSSAWLSSPSSKHNIIGFSNSRGQCAFKAQFPFGLGCNVKELKKLLFFGVCGDVETSQLVPSGDFIAPKRSGSCAEHDSPHPRSPYHQPLLNTRWTIFIPTSDEGTSTDSMAGRASWIRSPSRLYTAS